MPELSTVLLRRLHTVYVDQAGPRPGDPSTTEGLTALEAELLDRGYALTGPLRSALAWLGPTGLAAAGAQLIGDIDILLGADRTHMPLFRSFPASVPDDTHALWIDRVLTLLLQWPDQPCVLCATVGGVHPVAPCAHLVCRTCWDGSDHTGCPICHRRVDAGDPFIRPSPDEGEVPSGGGPLRLLAFGVDRAADSVTALGKLLARRTPLSPQDTEEARVLLAHVPAGLDWLPDAIPVRETKALVLGTLLRERRTRETVRALLPERLTTATDVLRLLAVWSGGEADLLEPPRLSSLPRPLRRDLLAVLDGLDPALLVEDVLRHEDLWKRAAEILHPFEQYARHPRASLAFAVLRGTDTTGTALGAALLATAAAHPHAVRVDGSRVRAATWLGRAEEALRGADPDRALTVLAERPGELVRRLDHLLRLYAADSLAPQVAEVLARRLPKAGPGPVLSALGRLRIRHLPGTRRVFSPRGQVAHSFAMDDDRAPLAEAVTAAVCELFEAEVLRRLDTADPYDMAVLDSRLAHLHVPSAERAAARALVTVPKGSFQALPDGEVLRMFLHWMEPARKRVDLDLSVVLFDADWNYAGLCDYTRLVHGERAVVHSGDLVSAPAPHGASEYVDIDLDALADSRCALRHAGRLQLQQHPLRAAARCLRRVHGAAHPLRPLRPLRPADRAPALRPGRQLPDPRAAPRRPGAARVPVDRRPPARRRGLPQRAGAPGGPGPHRPRPLPVLLDRPHHPVGAGRLARGRALPRGGRAAPYAPAERPRRTVDLPPGLRRGHRGVRRPAGRPARSGRRAGLRGGRGPRGHRRFGTVGVPGTGGRRGRARRRERLRIPAAAGAG
ncbi:MXAN_6230/SCO0854 family RING domain-containing protein [Streptomyces virginiae]|uniref:MXAN_6230/SCO0854 family RING domain-containing protein n=1 Tax=Streptomyces virginiae TaxID=1961 RepID=UPI00352D91E9